MDALVDGKTEEIVGEYLQNMLVTILVGRHVQTFRKQAFGFDMNLTKRLRCKVGS